MLNLNDSFNNLDHVSPRESAFNLISQKTPGINRIRNLANQSCGIQDLLLDDYVSNYNDTLSNQIAKNTYQDNIPVPIYEEPTPTESQIDHLLPTRKIKFKPIQANKQRTPSMAKQPKMKIKQRKNKTIDR